MTTPPNLNEETRSFRQIEFSLVQIGKAFYQRRPPIGSDVGKLIKIPSEKNSRGGWANAQTTFGALGKVFVQYDSKVFVEG